MRVHCPRCGDPVPVEATDGGAALPGDDRLRGGDRVCRNCGAEFGVYHY